MGTRNFIQHNLLGIFVSDYTGARPRRSYDLVQLNRVQDSSFSIDVERQNIKHLGTEHYVDQKIVYQPSVTLDLSYLLTDGRNERVLGLNIYESGAIQPSSQSPPFGRPFLNKIEEDKNLFLAVAPGGYEGEVNKQVGTGDFVGNDIIGFGNCYLTNMKIDASVGTLAKANLSFASSNVNYNCYGSVGDGLNPEPDPDMSKYSGIPNPSVNNDKGTYPAYSGFSFLQDTYSPEVSALLPGDIELSLRNLNYGGQILEEDNYTCNQGEVLIQSFSLNLPFQRKDLYGFGSMYVHSRKMMFPQMGSLDLKLKATAYKTGALNQLLCHDQKYDLFITLNKRICDEYTACNPQKTPAIIYRITNALFKGESFDHSIGAFGDATLSFTFENTQRHGLYMSGTFPTDVPVISDEQGPTPLLSQNQKAFLYGLRENFF